MQNEGIQKVLNGDEKVLWQGKPDGFVYGVKTFFSAIIGIAIAVFVVVGFRDAAATTPWWVIVIVVGFILIWLWAPIYRALLYPHILYLITDKRIIFQAGLIGRDFEFVDYDKIENSGVDVGLLDKILGKNTGSISIYANRLQTVTHYSKNGSSVATQNIPFVLSHVNDPYTVFGFLKKTSFDVKADINYPNALRPEQNPGYGTNYNVEQK
jgi:membrane protein YdbS with pleckstrin-like domain